jgi:hypothetical protein
MSTFKLTDPYGSAPTKAPFTQSVSTGTPWHNLPVTREYTLGQLLDQTIARCGENDAVVYADRDFRLSWYAFGEEVDLVAKGLMALGVRKGEKIGRNDPCPCGSGKKYKFCCGKNNGAV